MGSPVPWPPPTQAVGERLGVAEDVGSGIVRLSRAPHAGNRLSVRMTCIGPGTVRILDRTGHFLFGTSGCAKGVIYGASWRATWRDGRFIRVVVSPTTHWAVDVWLGNPATTPPSTA